MLKKYFYIKIYEICGGGGWHARGREYSQRGGGDDVG